MSDLKEIERQALKLANEGRPTSNRVQFLETLNPEAQTHFLNLAKRQPRVSAESVLRLAESVPETSENFQIIRELKKALKDLVNIAEAAK